MSENKINWCSCKDHNAKKWTVAADFYAMHFVPRKWVFEYRTIHSQEDDRVLYLFGCCDQCGGAMRSGASVPANIKGDELLAYVYREMARYRPYDSYDSHSGAYHGCVSKRAKWYQRQDSLTPGTRGKQFINLFKKEDRATVRDWLFRNHS